MGTFPQVPSLILELFLSIFNIMETVFILILRGGTWGNIPINFLDVTASETWQSHKKKNIHEKRRKKGYDIPDLL